MFLSDGVYMESTNGFQLNSQLGDLARLARESRIGTGRFHVHVWQESLSQCSYFKSFKQLLFLYLIFRKLATELIPHLTSHRRASEP